MILFAQRGIFAAAQPSAQTFTALDSGLLQLQATVIGSFPQDVVKDENDFFSIARYRSVSDARPEDGVDPFWVSDLRQWLEDAGLDLAYLDSDAEYAKSAEPIKRALWRTLTTDCTTYPITRVALEQMSTVDQAFDKILHGQAAITTYPMTDTCHTKVPGTAYLAQLRR